ncbi:hypothetical protein [Streptomyces spiralis]|uniref:hypothetical protein n=1 Tax=Streptomyces spiralis TaxID=66376 RepID=UPI0036AF214E
MDGPVPYVIVSGFFAVAPVLLTWFARVIRWRGGAGGGLGAAPAAYEEAFRTTRHAAHQEIRAQAERTSPTASPDGPNHRRRGAR